MRSIREAWASRHDPLVVDRNLDITFIVQWLLISIWGVLTVVVNRSILAIEFEFYPIIWGGCVGGIALTAAAAGITHLFVRANSLHARIACKTIEMYATTLLLVTMATYPVIFFIQVLTGASLRPDLAVLAITYLTFPTWRVFHLARRIQQVKTLARARNGN